MVDWRLTLLFQDVSISSSGMPGLVGIADIVLSIALAPPVSAGASAKIDSKICFRTLADELCLEKPVS